jgi:hypothetical protein
VSWLLVAAVTLAVLNTIAKELIDKQSMSKRAKLGWSAFVVVVASVGGILTVTRAVSSGRALAAVDAKYAFRSFTDEQKRALRDALLQRGAPLNAIQIHSISGDPESASFGIDLEQAIAAAGWPARHENMAFFGAPHGLQVRFEGMVQDLVDVPETDELACPRCFALACRFSKPMDHFVGTFSKPFPHLG